MVSADLIKKIEQNRLYRYLTILSVGWAIISAIYLLFAWFNLVPYYYADWHKLSILKPIVYLFPGDTIRLDFESYSLGIKTDVVSAKWMIFSKSNQYETEGLNPTIQLPPTKGGIYKLTLKTTTSDGVIRNGQSNIYVVQDKPEIVKLTHPIQVKLTPENTGLPLLKNIQKKGAEVYSGHNSWIDVKSSPVSNGNVNITLPPDEISVSNGKMFFRTKGSIKNINDYGAVHTSIKLDTRFKREQ